MKVQLELAAIVEPDAGQVPAVTANCPLVPADVQVITPAPPVLVSVTVVLTVAFSAWLPAAHDVGLRLNTGRLTAVAVKAAEPVAVLFAALEAVTVHVAVPALDVPTAMLPLVPEPVAVAPAPEQLTLADVAFEVVQLNVDDAPADTEVGLNEAPVTEGAATTLMELEPEAAEPAALYAVTVQVTVPVPLVPTAPPP